MAKWIVVSDMMINLNLIKEVRFDYENTSICFYGWGEKTILKMNGPPRNTKYSLSEAESHFNWLKYVITDPKSDDMITIPEHFKVVILKAVK
ncbi:MAG: hypothetical protein M0Q91_12565 [Methanoregula sp.]|jgi:nicotinic acid phosphoribosyltransferase|nr:hypothetical protein [Methanoregula sp.]